MASYILNIFNSSFYFLLGIFNSIKNFVRLLFIIITLPFNRQGNSLGQSFAKKFGSADVLRMVFSILRTVKPILTIPKKIILSYPNNRTILVTRYQDVIEVLTRDDVFEVVYESRMRKITDGSNFFLGMQNTPTYTRDVSNMRLAFRREDIATLVRPMVDELAVNIVNNSNGQIDFVQQLAFIIPTSVVQQYFGLSATQQQLIEWSSLMFHYLFLDLQANEQSEIQTLQAAEACRKFIDNLLIQHKGKAVENDTVLNRCLQLQQTDFAGLDNQDIRNNLIGLLIGAIPTIASATTYALNQLLQRPYVLQKIRNAYLAGQDDIASAYIHEAMRFHPVNPFIYRRANRDVIIASNSLRQHKIKKNDMVLASNLSAMFDERAIKSPHRFSDSRPNKDYILWGYGLHECFGAYFNSAVIPAMLKPLLQKNNLRHTDKNQIIIDSDTSFPKHMFLSFDN